MSDIKRRFVAALAAIVFFSLFRPASAEEPENAFFVSNGVKLHYLAAGHGEAVVLIHGFAANASVNWVLPGVFKKLSQHYRVVALDVRGHGGSGKPHEVDKYGLEMVEDIVRLLDHLKIKRAHVIGYSMGGFIAAKLLATHPDRLLSVVLGGAGWSREADDHAIVEVVAKSLEAGKGITPLIRALSPVGNQPATDEELEVRSRLIMLANDPQALAACIRGMRKLTIPRDRLVHNTVPVLAIVGDRDPFKRLTDAMNGVMNNLTIVIVKGGDHVGTFRSARFQTAVDKFLTLHSRPTAAAAGGK